MPGASGSAGSVWPRWAALRKAHHPGEAVIVATVAQGSSRVEDWAPGGTHFSKLTEACQSPRRLGFSTSAVVWHQGETEAWESSDGATYAEQLRKVIAGIRKEGIQSPIFVCLATRDSKGAVNATIRTAQASVWRKETGVYAGVDADSLGDEFRSDRVHFNEQGMTRFSELLEAAMTSPSDTTPARHQPK